MDLDAPIIDNDDGGVAVDDQAVDLHQPKAKRPRVGRNVAELLQAIEKDAEPAVGWARHLRAALLHAGEARRAEDDTAFALRRQGEDLLNAVRSHGEAAIDILFEAVMNLPQSVPLIAFLVSVASRLEQVSSGPGADGAPPPPPFLAPLMLQLSRRLSHALTHGHPLHARLLLRFLASLSSQGTVAARVVLDQLAAIVDAAEASLSLSLAGGAGKQPSLEAQKRALFYLHAVLAALPWWANSSLPQTIANSAEAATAMASDDHNDHHPGGPLSAAAAYVMRQGANDPSIAEGAHQLFARCERLLAAGEGEESSHSHLHPSLFQRSGEALSSRRQQQLGHWVDVLKPSTAGGSGLAGAGGEADANPAAAAMLATLRNASLPDAAKLCRAIRDAMAVEAADSSSSAIWRPVELAVPTISRPQDDPAVARLLLERPSAASASRRPLLPAQQKASKMEEDEQPAHQVEAAPSEEGAQPSFSFVPLDSDAYLTVTAAAAAPGEGEGENAMFGIALPAADEGHGDSLNASSSSSSSFKQQLSVLTSTGAASVSPLPPPSSSFSSVPAETAYHVKAGLQLFGPGGGLSSTPAVLGALQLSGLSALSLWCLRDVCADVVVAYHPFQQETAQALLSLPYGPAVAGRPHAHHQSQSQPPFGLVVAALEAILGQMLEPAGSPFPEPYYSLVIINILAQEANPNSNQGSSGSSSSSGAVAPRAPSDLGTRALGMAARVLWKFLFALDDALLPRVATWISHHVSCTRWEWIWEEWASSLTADDEAASSSSSSAASAGGFSTAPKDAQKRLMHSLLQRTFALVGPWHYERVVQEHFPKSLVDGGFIPPPQGQAASSIFFPEITIADADASKALSSSGAAGGGSSISVMDDGAAASSSSSKATEEQAAADTAAVDAFLRRVGKECPGLYGEFLLDPSGLVGGCRAYAGAVMSRMKARLDAAAMSEWLLATSEEDAEGGVAAARAAGLVASDAAADGASSSSAAASATRFLIFCHSLLMYSKANMRNTRIIIERYRPLLLDPASAGFMLGGVDGNDAEVVRSNVILDAVQQVWARHRYLANTTVTDLLELDIVTIGQVARHAFRLSAFDVQKVLGKEAPASYPSSVTASGASVSASAAVSLFTDRSLSLDAWELVERLLAHARENAHRARAELSLFTGAKPYDLKDEELDEDVAAAKEGELRETARKLFYRSYLEDGVRAVVEAAADLCRLLQKHLEASTAAAAAGGAGGASLGPQQTKSVREALRVALAHLRAIVRTHITGPSSDVSKAASAVEDGGSALIFDRDAYLASLHAVARKGCAAMDLDPDLAGLVLETALGFPSTTLAVPEALLRDADVPRPATL